HALCEILGRGGDLQIEKYAALFFENAKVGERPADVCAYTITRHRNLSDLRVPQRYCPFCANSRTNPSSTKASGCVVFALGSGLCCKTSAIPSLLGSGTLAM